MQISFPKSLLFPVSLLILNLHHLFFLPRFLKLNLNPFANPRIDLLFDQEHNNMRKRGIKLFKLFAQDFFSAVSESFFANET